MFYLCFCIYLCILLLVSFNSNTKDNNSGAVTAYPSGAPGVCAFSFVLVGLLVAQCCQISCFHFRVVNSATKFAQNAVRSVITTICFMEGSRFIYAFCIY